MEQVIATALGGALTFYFLRKNLVATTTSPNLFGVNANPVQAGVPQGPIYVENRRELVNFARPYDQTPQMKDAQQRLINNARLMDNLHPVLDPMRSSPVAPPDVADTSIPPPSFWARPMTNPPE